MQGYGKPFFVHLDPIDQDFATAFLAGPWDRASLLRR